MTRQTVMLMGATGTIGRATHAALTAAGHRVISPVRTPQDDMADGFTPDDPAQVLTNTPVDAIISCLASRTGLEAWQVDHALNSRVLKAAIAAKTPRFVLLSAICVQKPRLAFQHAKLAFEAELQAAPLTWSIVRPTAFFKSISGQIDRLRAGKPFLVFGDGQQTACKPISDRDVARFLLRCLDDPALANRILPIGGPGPALTPLDQGRLMFAALGQTPQFKHVPMGVMGALAKGLGALSLVSGRVREKAELARIGHYYASESMLVWDAEQGRYDADATPEFGADLLADYYAELAASGGAPELGAHRVFKSKAGARRA
jgi:divinyl chlorophyllide a 8-vinyl-reductase